MVCSRSGVRLYAPGLVSCVRQHASCQPCTSLFWSCLGFAVLKNNLSLLEGLECTPPSSARTKGDDTRYYVYTYLVRIPTFSFWFSVWWDMPTSAFFHSYQIRMYNTRRCTINSTAVSPFVYSLVGGGTHDTYVPPLDARVWRQLHVSAVARCSDSYCIFIN